MGFLSIYVDMYVFVCVCVEALGVVEVLIMDKSATTKYRDKPHIRFDQALVTL